MAQKRYYAKIEPNCDKGPTAYVSDKNGPWVAICRTITIARRIARLLNKAKESPHD